jgi:hypothetical protein
MTCIVDIRSETIGDLDLEAGEVVFVCQCDDGRTVLVSGQYFERFELPEIFTKLGEQLLNATIEIQRPQ